jgi:hypothetical protein
MKKLYVMSMTTALLGLALASTAVAQQLQEEFPAERTRTATCDDIDWNMDMLRNHPNLIGACQEVVLVDGESWARFDAEFVRVEPDGNVIFNVNDDRDRLIETVTLDPTTGQVAYIDDRATPFSQLRTTDRISLYVPEGQYGFATQPVAQERLATVIVPANAPIAVEPTTDRTLAQRDTRPTVLPTTAGPLPWLALGGLLSMLGGLGLTLRRRS